MFTATLIIAAAGDGMRDDQDPNPLVNAAAAIIPVIINLILESWSMHLSKILIGLALGLVLQMPVQAVDVNTYYHNDALGSPVLATDASLDYLSNL
jgi:xanthine/uracil permease